MLNVYPDYYPRFRCAADRCSHTCCAGWEIDIDRDTAEKYRRLTGPLAQRMDSALSLTPEPHFLLGPEERCPFLNANNLCDLILELGEDALCQICRDHPRFRSFLPGRTETGLGLCCEAAARLILSQKEPVRLLREGSEDPEDEDALSLIALRDALIRTAQDRTRPLDTRMDRVLSLSGAVLPARPMSAWAALYQSLERLDESWTSVLKQLRGRGDSVDIISFRRYMTGREHEYEQLLVYFLYRHILRAYEDRDAAGKAAFAVLSVRLLTVLGALHYGKTGAFTLEDQIEYTRMYSAEIEYSEENLETLYDALGGPAWNGLN